MSEFPALAEDGVVARAIDGFEPRPQQQAMAAAVAAAIEGQYQLLCEAGTGTGKTLAYLVPALQSGVRVIISTGTRNLQDQLFGKDLPMVRTALGQPVKVVLLKGRANYVCMHRLRKTEASAALDPEFARRLAGITRWATLTEQGDLAELSHLAEDDPLKPMITSTVDNCLGYECPEVSRCHVLNARRAAMDADIVVVNHHLFFADVSLREDGFGEVLPDARAVIFDEAHQLPDVATRFFGWTVSAGQLRELADDAERALRVAGGDLRSAQRAAGDLRGSLSVLRVALPSGSTGSGQILWDELRLGGHLADAVVNVAAAVSALADTLEPAADGGGEVASCLRRATEFARRLLSLTTDGNEDEVRWVELRGRGFAWRVAPLEVARIFSDYLRTHPAAWIFTSATLAVDGSFGHFAERMGLTPEATHVWQSPFDYMHQALCYLPVGLPEPREQRYTERLLEEVLPLLRAGGGRTFLLFTSHRALQRAAAWLSARVAFPLLIQGSAPKAVLLEQFVDSGNGVLLGTASFWEGVDVRGHALVCVVIDKLPFAAPDDPVLEARVRAMREAGREPFRDYQVPLAVINLKQGAGRLIRSQSDYGVLVLGDPRLVNRGYGRVFLRSLPTMPITQDGEEAAEFLRSRTAAAAEATQLKAETV
ncbi:MAG: ATP-dependent DNA helicase [Pseudomonadota bacterium]